MFTALDAAPEKLDPGEQNFVAQVRKHGWFGTHVLPDEDGLSFSYTTGFWLKFGFPEVILFALSRERAHDTFWHIYHELDAGRRPPIRVLTNGIFRNFLAVFLPVSAKQYPQHLGWSRWFYGNDGFECLQLVFPDRDGYFPWSREASDEFRARQPDLTEGNWSGLHI